LILIVGSANTLGIPRAGGVGWLDQTSVAMLGGLRKINLHISPDVARSR
jgi:hypothetical protein